MLNLKLKGSLDGIKINKTELENIIQKEVTEELKVSKNNTTESFIGLEFLNKFEELNSIGQFALSILILNYVVISLLFTIVTILYGNYLIKKYNIEVKYPKLAKLLHLIENLKNIIYL